MPDLLNIGAELSPLAPLPDGDFLLPVCLNYAQLNRILTACFESMFEVGREDVVDWPDATWLFPLLEALAHINQPADTACWDDENELCKAVLDSLAEAGGDLGAFTVALAQRILQDCLELLANQVLALSGDYLDIFKDGIPPTFTQLNNQYIADYGVDMPLPALEIQIADCELQYRWETAEIWSVAGNLTTCDDLIGPQGIQGIQGIPGIDGEDGIPGEDGEDFTPVIIPVDIGTDTDESSVASDDAVCGGMQTWMHTLLTWTNYILDERTNEQNGALVVARVVALFPFLATLESDLVDLAEALTGAVLSDMRAQINNPDYQNTYLCEMYGLVVANGGGYDQTLHDAIADATLTPPITDAQQILDHMLWLIGFQRMNRAFRVGVLSPSSACDILCGEDLYDWTRTYTFNSATLPAGWSSSGLNTVSVNGICGRSSYFSGSAIEAITWTPGIATTINRIEIDITNYSPATGTQALRFELPDGTARLSTGTVAAAFDGTTITWTGEAIVTSAAQRGLDLIIRDQLTSPANTNMCITEIRFFGSGATPVN